MEKEVTKLKKIHKRLSFGKNFPNFIYKNIYFFIEISQENAAICDQVAQVQENILITKEERRFLLKKLYQFEPHSDFEILPSKSNSHDHKKSRKRSHDDHGHKSSKSRKFNNSRMRKKVVQQIPLDSSGRPVFPIELGNLTVHSLGEVVTDRPEFHTEDVIYPVGYVSTRVYGSLKDPRIKCVYTCKISDSNGVPRFDITADNDLNAPIIGSTPDVCHALLLQYINEHMSENANLRPKGNDFFGLSHPTILNLIQSSPGTRKCVSYKWSKFEVGRSSEIVDSQDPNLSYEALQNVLSFNNYKNVPEIKEEPPDDIMDNSTGTLRDLLMS